MTKFSLIADEFLDHDYCLIGIHTTLEDYRLSFFLNKHLNLRLKKDRLGLQLKKKKREVCYSLYHFDDHEFEVYWNLIANTAEVQLENVGLFQDSETIIKLIPEKKKVDYFLKIQGSHQIEVLKNIRSIPNIITSYEIDPNSLKSKDFLIF